jgi:hypothetical protein
VDRLKCLLVAGVLALVVVAVAAGPASAAKGGNGDNAHACQQGGHENRFEAETGNPFKNAGACASHGARGGALTLLQVLADTYPCLQSEGTCWGTVSGSGLRPGSAWTAVDASTGEPFVFGETDATGSVNQKLDLACHGGTITSVRAISETSAGAKIDSPTVDAPCA